MAAGKGKPANGDVFRPFDHEEAVANRQPHLALIDGLDRPEIQRARVLVVKPLARSIQLFERVLNVVAVMRMQIIAAILLQREHPSLRIKRHHRLNEIPPAILRKDIDLHILRMRPGSNILGLHIQRALPKMPLRSPRWRKRSHKGPAAIERVLSIKVRVTGENLALAIAQQLLRQKAFRQQLGNIRLHNLTVMR